MKTVTRKTPALSAVLLFALGFWCRSQAGSLIAWGSGLGTNCPSALTNVVAIAAGSGHGLALLADGSVVGWGDNSYSQTNVPADLSNAVALAAGYYHSLALKADGTLAAWGRNTYAQTAVPAFF